MICGDPLPLLWADCRSRPNVLQLAFISTIGSNPLSGGRIKLEFPGSWRFGRQRCSLFACAILVPVLVLGPSTALQAFQLQNPAQTPVQVEFQLAAADLPDAPEPQNTSSSPTPKPNPCPPRHGAGAGTPATAPGEPGDASRDLNPSPNSAGVHPATVPCSQRPLNWYQRFVNGPRDKPLTPHDKAWLAVRNLVDPFNLITIGGEAAFAVGLDSHSPYGPGMPGYARYVGVSVTEDMTGEFFGTFLIPSIAHQDPHYYRMEHARIPRRVFHAIAQVVWTQGDNGKGMPNYANLIGFGFDDAIANLYVPGRETEASASAARYGIGLATAPIGNFISEFLPDVASHIHVQIVILQRIINQVAIRETATGTNPQ